MHSVRAEVPDPGRYPGSAGGRGAGTSVEQRPVEGPHLQRYDARVVVPFDPRARPRTPVAAKHLVGDQTLEVSQRQHRGAPGASAGDGNVANNDLSAARGAVACVPRTAQAERARAD